jgi:hypothetical protein
MLLSPDANNDGPQWHSALEVDKHWLLQDSLAPSVSTRLSMKVASANRTASEFDRRELRTKSVDWHFPS